MFAKVGVIPVTAAPRHLRQRKCRLSQESFCKVETDLFQKTENRIPGLFLKYVAAVGLRNKKVLCQLFQRYILAQMFEQI